MNSQIIRILLSIPMRLSAVCGWALFVLSCVKNFSPAMVADLAFYVFLRRKGENTTLSLWATKGGERNERRQ